MTLQVTGKNIETGESLQDYIAGKIDDVLQKYVGPEIAGHVRIEKERGRFRTACSIRLRTGLLLEAQGEGATAYDSADEAIAHLEKRVRRYKRRLKNHHHQSGNGAPAPEFTVRDYVVDSADDAADGGTGDGPVIVADTELVLRELSVRDAVLQLDLTDRQFLLFRNAKHGGVNVVYRRQDGNIGWIDPSPGQSSGAAKGA